MDLRFCPKQFLRPSGVLDFLKFANFSDNKWQKGKVASEMWTKPKIMWSIFSRNYFRLNKNLRAALRHRVQWTGETQKGVLVDRKLKKPELCLNEEFDSKMLSKNGFLKDR